MTAQATMVTFSCPGCGRPFKVPASYAGRRATCKTCQTKVVVPGTPISSISPGDNGESKISKSAIAQEAAISPSAAPLTDEAVAEVPSETAEPGNDAAPRRQPRVAIVSEAQSPPVAAAVVAAVAVPIPAADPAPPTPPPPPARPESPTQIRQSVRTRRLESDFKEMSAAFSGDGPIHIDSTVGDPPETYIIEYRIKGLQKGFFGPKKRDAHQVEIQLTSEFPKVSPKCKMLTPVFHPNIDETTICVTDHWTAGERLVDLVVRIGEMLAFQAYNIKSPLNGEAAKWADLHPKQLPTDPRNLHPGEAR